MRSCATKDEETIKEFAQAWQSSPESPGYLSMLPYAYGRTGKSTRRAKFWAAPSKKPKPAMPPWRDLAGIYAGLGEKDHAFTALELAFTG